MNCQVIKANKSDYKILLSKNATSFDKIASDTLNKYLEQSTGVKLPVITEDSACLGNFISLGQTQKLAEANIEVRHGKSGYTIKESNGNLYIFGEGSSGVIWGVQAFLEIAINYKYYAKDEVQFDKVSDIDADGYDYFYTPTIPNRSSGFAYCRNDIEYATGLKAYGAFGYRADGSLFWGTWNHELSCHNHLTIMPLSKYYDQHPEWYNDKKNELCLSNMEMRDEFFKNLIYYFERYSEQTHFLLGHEDNPDMCRCENCMKRINEVKEGGLHLEFTNDMARRTEKWRLEHCPNREISVGMFAYVTGTSMVPPVKREGDKIVPISDSVIAEPNVFILFAPIGAKEHNRPITAPENKYFYRCFDYWNKVCKRFGIWLYYGSFRRSFEATDGIYIFKENIKAFKDFGCEFYFVENNSGIGSLVLQKLHLYVNTQLEWNVEQDTDDLINDFMRAYYKSAAPAMRKFLDYIIAFYAKVRARVEKLTGRKYYYGMCHRDVNQDGFWDLNAVYDLTLILEEADKAIDESDYSEEIKQTLKDRVHLERLFTIFVQLEYFIKEHTPYDEARSINAYPKKKALELVDIFEKGCKKFNIKRVDGDGLLETTLEKWRREINWSARAWEDAWVKSLEKVDQLWEEWKI